MTTFLPHIIETKNLLLRELSPRVHDYVLAHCNDSDLMQFFGFSKPEELETEKDRYKKGLGTFNRTYYIFHMIERSSMRVIGWCGYHTIATLHNRGEVGYTLYHERDKRKGYMKEALAGVLEFGFTKLKLHRVEALVGSENVPSLKLIHHFGFTQEAVLREHYCVNGVMEDSLMFALLKNEYASKN